ncbi:MAG TPA: HD-GYP domain-containing protein [Longimicrobiales bacterium]|nr:HD-GYP domain-containing protein [Longimicrobiales bacterium]
MNRVLRAYVWCVITAAAAFVAMLPWGSLRSMPLQEVIGAATFVFLAVASHAVAFDSTLGKSRPVKSSTAFIPLLASAVLFSVPVLVIAVACVIVLNDRDRRQKGPTQIAFNVSQTVIGYGAGALVYRWLTENLQRLQDPGVEQFIAEFVGFYALVGVFFFFNITLVCLYISLRDRQSFLITFSEAVGRGGGNLGYAFLASPVALLAVYLYREFSVVGLLAVVFPLLLVRYTYSSAIQLQRANRDLLRVLIKAIETRDPYTSGHSLRVSTLARLIAEDHGLRPSTIKRVEDAALLHDIGKIDALYAEIISKSASLSEDERAVIQTHAVKGADLLASLTSLDSEVIVGVRHHHERYDGKGYPDGLEGKAIPIAARIIMLCDAIDAMLSDRPYRRALPVSEVRGEIQRCAGTQFDPDLVASILRHNTLERAETLVDRSGARSKAPRAAVVG